ncbi:MAG: CYTH domain-containing protein [bacterium]|nr:CYTH domain-containing protein [bacterium]
MQTYEVEIKALLGNSKRADEVRAAMKTLDPSCALHSKNKQLNHYFEGGSLDKLATILSVHLSPDAKVKLNDLVARSKNFSVRTRDKDGDVFIVTKVSVDDTTSENGISRMELEEKVPLPLEDLDALLLSAGFSYQAKWSREREEYVCKGVNVTLDKNAGYGWLAEFELVVTDAARVGDARREVSALMQRLGVQELPQERLERMFAFYNANWPEYYGTEKVFVVE